MIMANIYSHGESKLKPSGRESPAMTAKTWAKHFTLKVNIMYEEDNRRGL